jgi:hypothetical protein
MQLSAEVRWFWRGDPQPECHAWFQSAAMHGCPAGGGKDSREDIYLSAPAQADLGIKRRGNKPGVEVKGLVAISETRLASQPFAGSIEMWSKWSSEALTIGHLPTIATSKLRWLRKFDTSGSEAVEVPLKDDEEPADASRQRPVRGCNVELTRVTLAGDERWWTFGFESFGPLTSIVSDLCKAEEVIAACQPPRLPPGQLASYPAWLQRYALADAARRD